MDWSVPSLKLASKTYLDAWECGEVTLDTEKCDPCYLIPFSASNPHHSLASDASRVK